MFENFIELSDAEKSEVKRIHSAFRANTASRYGNLAWGFLRGLPYKRVERKTREQIVNGKTVYHNLPSAVLLTLELGKVLPEFRAETKPGWIRLPPPHPLIVSWLENKEGAVPAPSPSYQKARLLSRRLAQLLDSDSPPSRLDAIRDELDELTMDLPPKEIRRLQALSAKNRRAA